MHDTQVSNYFCNRKHRLHPYAGQELALAPSSVLLIRVSQPATARTTSRAMIAFFICFILSFCGTCPVHGAKIGRRFAGYRQSRRNRRAREANLPLFCRQSESPVTSFVSPGVIFYGFARMEGLLQTSASPGRDGVMEGKKRKVGGVIKRRGGGIWIGMT